MKRPKRSETALKRHETTLLRLSRGQLPRPMYWVLHEDHSVEPLESGDALEWARGFGVADRRVAQDWWVLEMAGGPREPRRVVRAGIRVSTVFIGLDANLWGDGPALLFETMVFGGPRSGDMARYATWEEAAAGHGRFVRRESVWLSRLGSSGASFWEAGLRGFRGGRRVHRGPSVARVIASGHGDMRPEGEPA